MAVISVVMVCYNAEQYVLKALSCITKQTFRDFELVFVDNGSTDRTMELARNFLRSCADIAVRYGVIEKNDGLPKGRNKGLSLASGEYVMFHDADDWMDPDCLTALAKVIYREKPERIMQQLRFVNDKGEVIDELLYPNDVSRWTKNSLQGDLFLRRVITKHQLAFARNAYYDDFYFTNLFNSVSNNACFLFETHYNMLMHEHSMTHKFNAQPGYFTTRLEGTFSELSAVTNILSDKQEKMMYEYGCIQRYYSDVFRGVGLSLPNKIREYLVYRKIMNRYHPDYLRNKNVKLTAPNGFSGHFKRNIWVCIQAEKVDKLLRIPLVMSIVLTVYHVALRTGVYRYAG